LTRRRHSSSSSLSDCECCWQNGKELAEELRAKLELQEQSRARQFARMHDEWTDGVFRALNEPVTAKVAAMDARQLTQRKYDAYQKFLDITNKKGGLFRDIIIESEYNPLQDVTFLEHRTVVDDPVKRVIRRREEEVRVLMWLLSLICRCTVDDRSLPAGRNCTRRE